jgi:tetratricopeptide (TPR) repeat protein
MSQSANDQMTKSSGHAITRLPHDPITRFVVVLAVLVAACSPAYGQERGASGEEADRLYANRTDLPSVRHAVEIWRAALKADPANFDASWKIARADYWLAGHAPDAERPAALDDGMTHGRLAATLQPNRPEGHFWLAANMGTAAERSGRAGLRYRKTIKDELETVLRLDPAFLQGSADRALGRWYHKVPRLFGGSTKSAEEHLRASLKYDPNSTTSHYFLAELLLDDGRREDARAEAQLVLDAPINHDWAPEDQEFKAKARQLLAKLGPDPRKP